MRECANAAKAGSGIETTLTATKERVERLAPGS